MSKNSFDKKVAEIFEQHENQLPLLKNKEQVWDNIENKLRKPSKRKFFYYTTIATAACVALLIGFMFLFHQNDIKQQSQAVQAPPQSVLQKGNFQEKPVYKETVQEKDFIVQQKKVQEKPKIAIKETLEGISPDTLAPNIIKEESPVTVQENMAIAETPNPVSPVSSDQIKIRVSLSPRNNTSEPQNELKMQFGSVHYAKSGNKEINKEASKKLFQIPLK